MARMHDGFIFIVHDKLKSKDGKAFMEVNIEEKELVICKHCKHRSSVICNNIEFYECEHLRYKGTKCGVSDDWFCADGELEEEYHGNDHDPA